MLPCQCRLRLLILSLLWSWCFYERVKKVVFELQLFALDWEQIRIILAIISKRCVVTFPGMFCQVCGTEAMQHFTCEECGTKNESKLARTCVCEMCGQTASRPTAGNTTAVSYKKGVTTSEWMWSPSPPSLAKSNIDPCTSPKGKNMYCRTSINKLSYQHKELLYQHKQVVQS